MPYRIITVEPIKVGGNELIFNHILYPKESTQKIGIAIFMTHSTLDYILTWTWIMHLIFSVIHSTAFQKEVVLGCTYLLLYNLDTQVK